MGSPDYDPALETIESVERVKGGFEIRTKRLYPDDDYFDLYQCKIKVMDEILLSKMLGLFSNLEVLMFYELSSNIKYAELIDVTQADCRKIWWSHHDIGDPLPDLNDWISPVLKDYQGENGERKKRKVADFSGQNFVSHKAKQVLDDLWGDHVDLYPVQVPDAQDPRYYMVVVKTVLDCLDVEKSVFARRTNGDPYLLKEWRFKEDVIGDVPIFRFKDDFPKSVMGDVVYVSERFKNFVLEEKLKGAVFNKKLNDDAPIIS